MELIYKNMSRDLRKDEAEQKEKDYFSTCAVLFLKFLFRNKAIYSISEPSDLFETAMYILEFEANNNFYQAPDCDIERSVSITNVKRKSFYFFQIKKINFI